MKTLKELLDTPDNRPRVLKACEDLVEDELNQAKGLSGIALRTAFAVVQALDDSFIQKALNKLFDDFMISLEPFWSQSTVASLEDDWRSQAPQIADALLGAADKKIERVQNKSVKKVYSKLRPKAASYVQNAVPGLAQVVLSFS